MYKRQISEGQWSPLLSLPRYLGINPEKPIISDPYIFSTNELKTDFIPTPVFAETSIASSPGNPITSSICFFILSGSDAGRSILFTKKSTL